MINRLLRKLFPFHIVYSFDNRFFYIPEVVSENTKPDHRSTHGAGWFEIATGDLYPFAYYNIGEGETKIATDIEIAVYREAMEHRL